MGHKTNLHYTSVLLMGQIKFEITTERKKNNKRTMTGTNKFDC